MLWVVIRGLKHQQQVFVQELCLCDPAEQIHQLKQHWQTAPLTLVSLCCSEEPVRWVGLCGNAVPSLLEVADDSLADLRMQHADKTYSLM